MLKRSLKMSFWIWYDYMGGWFIINLTLITPFMFFSLLFFNFVDWIPELLYPVCISLLFLYFFIAQLFVANCASHIIDEKKSLWIVVIPSINQVFSSKILAGIEFCFLFSTLIFINYFLDYMLDSQNIYLMTIIEVIIFWSLMILYVSFIWLIPSLAWKKLKTLDYLKWGIILSMANPGFTLIVGMCYTMFLMLNFFPVFFFGLGFVFPAIFLVTSYEIMSRKYEAIKKGANLPEQEIYNDARDEFLNRDWIHIIKPWEMR